jgi:hypothetical protein
MARSGFCIPGGRQRRLIASAKELFDLPIQVCQGTGGHGTARIDHDIPRSSQFREPDPHNLANPPLEAIADNGLADGSRCSEANPWIGAVSSQTKRRKTRPAVAETVVVNFAEFAGS